MGSQFTDWAQATGPMYMGANGIMEVVWTLISVAVCYLGFKCWKQA